MKRRERDRATRGAKDYRLLWAGLLLLVALIFACVGFSCGHIRRRLKNAADAEMAETAGENAAMLRLTLESRFALLDNVGEKIAEDPQSAREMLAESREICQRLRLQAPRLYELDGADGDQRRRNRRFLLPRLFPHGDGRAILHHRRNQRPAGQRRGRPHYERARAQPEDGQGHRRGFCGLYAGNVLPDDGCGNLRRRGARLHRRIERRNRRRLVKRASHGDGQSAGRGGGFFGDRPSGRGGASAGSRRGAAGRWARAGRGEAALLLPED